jgi:hypothetical protein
MTKKRNRVSSCRDFYSLVSVLKDDPVLRDELENNWNNRSERRASGFYVAAHRHNDPNRESQAGKVV